MRYGILAWVLLFIAFFRSAADAQSTPREAGDEAALATATRDLCHVQVAMLGESASHGDGHTLAFKVALVERLIDQCGFNSVFFEASHYEFIHLNRQLRAGQAVDAGGVLSAAGGLWEFNQEFQPLAPFLLAKAQVGSVFLGGMDDQLGQLGQNYANDEMVTELTNLLPQKERKGCQAALHKRIYNDYAEAPYAEADRAQIESCLSAVRRANAADETGGSKEREERQEMISAAERWIKRDFSSDAAYKVNRDRSMLQNFEWLLKQQPERHKVILWAATVHLAKQGDPTWADRTGTNFGSFVHRKYGNRAFSLGFSALAGSFREPGQGIREIPLAPVDSVEARAFGKNDSGAIYLGPPQLARMGTAPGAYFRHSYETLSWSTFLNGVVVFQKEHPPSRVNGK